MTTETLKELKKELSELKIKCFDKKRAKKKNEKESIEESIQFLIKNIISKYELTKYDSGIREECHNTEYFIFDVEGIIIDQEGMK